MTRRADPQRLFQARRSATVQRVMTHSLTRDTAEALGDAWEARATARGIPVTDPDYWAKGESWILEHRSARWDRAG